MLAIDGRIRKDEQPSPAAGSGAGAATVVAFLSLSAIAYAILLFDRGVLNMLDVLTTFFLDYVIGALVCAAGCFHAAACVVSGVLVAVDPAV